ncbi:unnamed protein product [Caenorhabditis angaria]|uniref:SH3 domain-containing protein n=1 Tax=Caenorhabditis angaria TaxID=860376 RepID=A0A9P1IZX1_9PELO|nr:unnamed protein product [Caenorhabditis angaria]
MGSILADDIIFESYPNEPDISLYDNVEYFCAIDLPSTEKRNSLFRRYPQLIPMSADESTVNSTAVPDITPSMAATIPHAVYEQLNNDFLPAAKAVAGAGTNLLKAFHFLQESLISYCDATHKLIKSADSANEKSKHEAAELSKVFKKFVQVVNANPQHIAKFEAISLKINDYSSKDKEKTKSEITDYKKELKKISKKGSSREVTDFNRRAARDWTRQQELRYKFFNEKITEWIEGFASLSNIFDDNEVEHIVATSQVVPKKEENPAPVVDWHQESHDHAAKIVQEEVVHHPIVPPPIQPPIQSAKTRASTDSSVASSLDDIPSARKPTLDNGVTLVSNHRRNSIEITPARVAPITIPPPPVASPRAYESIQHERVTSYHQPENTAPGVSSRAGRTIPGAVPVFGLTGEIPKVNVPVETRYVPTRNGYTPYNVVTSDQIRVGRVVQNPITEEQMNVKKFQVESNYVANASPSHQPRKPMIPRKEHVNEDFTVATAFNPSQYGSILIVNDDFNASSGEQMTVNRGDKVILLKCGSRGWVFVRDAVSMRTGWVPEPFVNL